MERLEELMGHVRRCHSEVQLRHFIVVKGGAFCDYGAMRQALRELHGRVSVVRESLLLIAEAELDVEEVEGKTKDFDPTFDCETSQYRRDLLAATRARSILSSRRQDIIERIYELSHFYAMACALKDKIEKKHGPLTPELHAKLDAEMWVHRLRLDIGHELRSGGIQRGTMDLVRSLPSVIRELFLDEIKNDATRLVMFSESHYYDLPETAKLLTSEEVCAYVSDIDSTRIGAG